MEKATSHMQEFFLVRCLRHSRNIGAFVAYATDVFILLFSIS